MNTLFSDKNLTRTCLLLSLALTTVAVLLHFFSWSMAGGLWRDELVTVNIASLPTWRAMAGALMNDSFPGLFHAVVRVWMALGLAHSDLGMRALGLGCGLFLLASFWAAGRMLRLGPPLLLLSLVALNPVVIRYGDSIRAYGLGTAFIILTTGLLWRFVEQPGWRRGLLASLAAVLSVQALYQNAFFVLAICLAGAVVSLRQRDYRKVVGILSIGLVAAISLAPYVKPLCATHYGWQMLQSGTTFWDCLGLLNDMAGYFLGVWVVVAVMAICLGIGRIVLKKFPAPAAPTEQPDLPLFCAVAMGLGILCFGMFIKMSGLPTQVWYYIPALCFAMLCADGILPCVLAFTQAGVLAFTRVGLLAIATLALALSPSDYFALRWRMTNGDEVANTVAKAAAPGDFIIVNLWYFGVTFAHYYHGSAPWTTLPSIDDFRFQRFDLLMKKLQTPKAIDPVLDRVRATLQSGHRVWIAGQMFTPPPDAPMPADPPLAPHGPSGWLDWPYYVAWGQQLGWYLQNHAAEHSEYATGPTHAVPVSQFEHLKLLAFYGWKTNAPGTGDQSHAGK